MDSSLPPVSPPPPPVSPSVPVPTTSSSQGLTLVDAKVRPLQTGGHPEVKADQGLTFAEAKVRPLESSEIEVIPESPEISPELAEHVERVVRGEIELPGPIEAGVHQGQPVTIEPSVSQQPNIVLPLP